MNCARLRQILDAYIDGELDRATAAELDRHLAACPACAALREGRLELGRTIRAQAPRFVAPEGLRRSVREGLERAATRPSRGRPSWTQVGALAAVAAAAGLAVGLWFGQPPRHDVVLDQLVASHVASLAPGRKLTDLASEDRHALKPWFVGKTDFAPVVRDLTAEGFELIGARLDHIGDRQASAVVYRVRNHYVNLFAWRSERAPSEGIRIAPARGFGVATWSKDGLRFAAVSDVDRSDLERFARLVAEPLGGPGS